LIDVNRRYFEKNLHYAEFLFVPRYNIAGADSISARFFVETFGMLPYEQWQINL
jgi:hypothetical protein